MAVLPSRVGWSLHYFNINIFHFSTGTKREEAVGVDFLLNATGPGTVAANVPLIADLMDAGLAEEHPFGGIRLDERTHQVLPNKVGVLVSHSDPNFVKPFYI